MFLSKLSVKSITQIAAFAVALVWAQPAVAAEEILNYSSYIEVQTDRSVIVTETIRVRAEGNDIRRGIWRYVPTKSENDLGYTIDHGIEILDVRRDGEPDDWHTESISNGEKIYIGNADVFLSPGVYQYTLKYRTWRQIRDLPDADELYWNVTGNFWQFPIQASVAQVVLPETATVLGTTAYTGAFGSKSQDATISKGDGGNLIFRSDRAFGPGEGLSIVVGFEKGTMTPKNQFDQFLEYLSDRRALFLPGIGFLAVLLYFFSAWNRVGRDPQKGTVVPLYHPPKEFSPALTHYVQNFGWRKSGWTAFTAALMALATKGLVVIGSSGSGKHTKVTVTEEEPHDLPSGERLIYDWLHAKGEVVIDKAVGKSLHQLHADFIETIEDENRRAYFNHNTGYVLFGFVLSAIVVVAMLYFEVLHFGWVVLSIATGVAVALVSNLFLNQSLLPKLPPAFYFFVMFILFGNVGTGFLASLDWVDFGPTFDGDWFANARDFVREQPGAIAILSIVCVNVGFGLTMRAATVQGRKVMDEIEGFKMYMETAEKERLNYRDAPDMTVSRFERLLPYAVALGVEKPWSEHFEHELSRNAKGPEDEQYNPHWHSGRGWRASRIAKNIATTATGVSAAMIAAQPASSSSSGFSSGGGFSGGGGGGGGGGGW